MSLRTTVPLEFGREIPDDSGMELSWLEDFLALAETGSFSRAASQRSVTQPAFSRRIRALEEWVGTPLFDRATHRVALTEAGRTFRGAAEEIVRLLPQAREEARVAGSAAGAALTFAATHVLSLTFFPRWLNTLEHRARLGALRLVSDTMRACEQIMAQGQAQFLLCHHHAAAPGRLDATPFRSVVVGEDVIVPLSAPDERGRPRFPLPGTRAAPLPLLSYSSESGMGRIVDAVRPTAARDTWLEPVFTSHLATVLRTMAREGRGVAWVPLSIAVEDLRDGELVRAGEETWDVPVEIRLYRARHPLSAAAEEFWSLVA
jgi:DNA-binding transcriptional LysR family regulator